MPKVERTRDVIEIHWTTALVFWVWSILALLLGLLLHKYRGDGYIDGLIYALFIFAGACFLYGLRRAIQVRQVIALGYECPYCQQIVELTDEPEDDFMCTFCKRKVPVRDKDVLPVDQVRCGYCNTLNYYSEKTEFLICEECQHQIPIHQESPSGRQLPSYVAVQEDATPYELVLIDYGTRVEELIECLQHMLALNRQQVRAMLDDLPATLLTGINKRKAELLRSQIEMHDGAADVRPLL